MDPEKLQAMHLPLDGLWLPKAASTLASVVDDPWWIIYYASGAAFIAMMGPMAWFAYKYRRKHKDQKALSQMDHSQAMEIAWSVLPLIFFFWVFVLGFRGFLEMFVAPAGAQEVQVTGQKWQWNITYDHNGGKVAVGGQGATFVFPKGKKFKLVMKSVDVLHSFYVPNFRIKSDVIPGRYTTLWFEATEAGEYPLLCTEYCGTNHSNMIGMIKIVETEAEWKAWLDAQDTVTVSPESGKKIFEEKGCTACHSVDGTRLIGPTMKGLWGRMESTNKGPVSVNEEYIAESILQPQAKIVDGYAPAMPPYQGQLKQEHIDALIEYMKTLK